MWASPCCASRSPTEIGKTVLSLVHHHTRAVNQFFSINEVLQHDNTGNGRFTPDTS